MADIRHFGFLRNLRSETSSFVPRYKRGRLVQGGRALGFWFLPLSTSVAEVPVDDKELTFLFHARSRDFQDVSVQSAVAFRVLEPKKLAERLDFSIDLKGGRWLVNGSPPASDHLLLLGGRKFAILVLAPRGKSALCADLSTSPFLSQTGLVRKWFSVEHRAQVSARF